jgi:Na+/melibiose symporter-like transporter
MTPLQIGYLVIGILFIIGSLVSGYFSFWSSRNRPNENKLETYYWLIKPIVKNRMLLLLLLSVILATSAIAFIKLAF